MRNTLNTECLLEAAENYFEARRKHDRARDEYIENGGYSWGYYGASFVEEKEKAAEEFQQLFIEQVRAASNPSTVEGTTAT
jgi:hypothetical protein